MGINDEIEKIVSGRWIAGEYISDVVKLSKELNHKGVKSQINYLGELFTDIRDVRDATNTYAMLIDEISKNKIKAHISIKLSQLGMLIDHNILEDNYASIVRMAKKKGIFVWMDMEEEQFVDKEIELYLAYVKSGNVGICIQSYMKRSIKDVVRIVNKKGVVRLVKGAYYTPKNHVYLDRPAATKNYLKIMNYLFTKANKFMVATHDINLVDAALYANKKYRRDVEYSMLNGINNKYIINLAKAGESTSLYLPFGRKWIDYSFRRLKEIGNIRLITGL
jgi:proline dehydrogenase